MSSSSSSRSSSRSSTTSFVALVPCNFRSALSHHARANKHRRGEGEHWAAGVATLSGGGRSSATKPVDAAVGLLAAAAVAAAVILVYNYTMNPRTSSCVSK